MEPCCVGWVLYLKVLGVLEGMFVVWRGVLLSERGYESREDSGRGAGTVKK